MTSRGNTSTCNKTNYTIASSEGVKIANDDVLEIKKEIPNPPSNPANTEEYSLDNELEDLLFFGIDHNLGILDATKKRSFSTTNDREETSTIPPAETTISPSVSMKSIKKCRTNVMTNIQAKVLKLHNNYIVMNSVPGVIRKKDIDSFFAGNNLRSIIANVSGKSFELLLEFDSVASAETASIRNGETTSFDHCKTEIKLCAIDTPQLYFARMVGISFTSKSLSLQDFVSRINLLSNCTEIFKDIQYYKKGILKQLQAMESSKTLHLFLTGCGLVSEESQHSRDISRFGTCLGYLSCDGITYQEQQDGQRLSLKQFYMSAVDIIEINCFKLLSRISQLTGSMEVEMEAIKSMQRLLVLLKTLRNM